MRGLATRTDDIVVGARVAAGRGRRRALDGSHVFDEVRIERVIAVDRDAALRGDNARVTLADGAERRETMMCHTGWADRAIAPSPWETLWTEPLPADDAVAAAFVEAVCGAERIHDVALLWIACAMPGGPAYAHLVTDRPDDERDRLVASDGCMSRSEHAIAVRAQTGLRPRMLVAARLGRADVEEGVCVQSLDAVVVLMDDVGLAAAADAFPARRRRINEFITGHLASFSDLEERSGRAWARAEPSEALVVAWRDGRDVRCKCIATSGIAFYHQDDPDAYAENQVPGPGLWLWGGVEFHAHQDHEGGWDADMDGDWTPAETTDLERLAGDAAAVGDDIRDYAEDQGDDLVARYVAMAREAAAQDDPVPAA